VRAWTWLLLAVLLAGCSSPPGRPDDGIVPPPAGSPFDGQAAYHDVERQVLAPDGSVRHRVPGTAGNDEAAQLIADALAGAGWNVTWDRWNASYACRDVQLHNVVAERAGASGKLVILGAHYDTRPIAESDADPINRTLPIPGANDGGSGVGVLLELAKVLNRTPDTVRLVFFDAEDGGDMPNACGTDWLMGSRHYAQNLSAAERDAAKAMVLVDLVGDPNLTMPRELSSYQGLGRPVQDRIYGIAGGLGYRQFSNETRAGATWSIEDDHEPFVEEGIRAVDLIHLVPNPKAFPEWHHTQHDDMSHVSAASLEAVGRTLQAWIGEGAQADET
jgi:Zn-dependent M28 family amino/carboxypeptidase